ncbi:MAG: DUF3536 domain-containing protein [Bacillota bacterium]
MERYVCIHGHFYQPPRENPWLEAVELQDSAYPYHDWNEKISAECYRPNATARILNQKGWIRKIVNNFTKISFNFGPTLLHWLKVNDPEIYSTIIAADRESRQNFSGHGSALAQAYNHMIMPLANFRDKHTQVVWGIRDFKKRFGRSPEGMWLPETAVDLESLDIMAEQGIKFTILSPYQARRVKKSDSNCWMDIGPRGIDPSMAYKLSLPSSGRSMNIFFYDGPISGAVAYERLLSNGENFARRLTGAFSDNRQWPQLINIATDGETFGHHHRHGEMALAYTLDYIESHKLARITNYGEYLEKYPPTSEIEIREGTSWSCAHGVERWKSDCGCSTGSNTGMRQLWRAPLRDALNWLRDTISPLYEDHAQKYLKNPWSARDGYIDVVLDRSPDARNRFLEEHASNNLTVPEQVTVWSLLEMQRYAMLMFTSCGWFFDEISGIETVQILEYAGRVIQLGQELFNFQLENDFLELLGQAKSNLPALEDGARIYQKHIKPAIVDLPKVGAHYAISSLFEKYGGQTRIYCYTVDQLERRCHTAGKAQLAVGKVKITSEITMASDTLSFMVVHFGYHYVHGGVKPHNNLDSHQRMIKELTSAFNKADIPGMIRLMDRYFGEGKTYSLKQLFRDQQRKIVGLILDSTLGEVEADYRDLYERHVSLMRFLKDLGIPLPHALQCAADFYLNVNLRRSLENDTPDFDRIGTLLRRAMTFDVELDGKGLGYVLERTLERVAGKFQVNPTELSLLESLDKLTGLARALPFEVDLSELQNIYYTLLQTDYPVFKAKDEDEARSWVERFINLGDRLKVEGGK